jgi:gamma-glutamylcyclotransferase (GGCT)/AIG2-like uncharacterized protein YtfP
MAEFETNLIFVYGTLKRGEERAGRWPHEPVSVCAATTAGTLYDLGEYPAMAQGDGVVLGELWKIAPADMAETLRVLDEIECYGNEDVDLYVRHVVECRTMAGESRRAYTYFYAQSDELNYAMPVAPDAAGCRHWHRNTNPNA